MSIIKKINFTDTFTSETTPAETIVGASSFLVGTGVPGGGLGNDGDVYLDSANGNLYIKASGAWTVDSVLVLPASGIVNTPSGNIAAIDVQTALNELDTEKLAKTGGTITGSLTVDGDLTVSGTTTTIDTTNLEVTDKNININNGGNDASSEGAGLNVERTGTDGSLVYEDALGSKWKLGAVGSEKEVIDVSSSQALTNKDYDGGTASDTNRTTIPKDTTANLALLTNKEGTIAYDTTLKSFVINDGTEWKEVSGSGGGDGINYVVNPNFEVSSDNVTVTANITKALEVTNKLRNTQSLKITIDTLATTADYVDFDLNTFDDQDTDESKEVVIVFDINSSNANYTSDDVEFVLRDVTNSIDILISNDNNGLIKNVNGNRTFVGVAQTVAGVTDYKLRMNILVAPTTDSILYFDTIKVGPDTFGPGNIKHGMRSFTGDITGSTSGTLVIGTGGGAEETFSYARDGEDILLRYIVKIGTSGTTDVVGSYLFPVPSGITIDHDSYEVLGTGSVTVTGTANPDARLIAKSFTGKIMLDKSDTTNLVGGDTILFDNNNIVTVFARAKVVGWSTGNLLSTQEASYSIVKARYKTTTAGNITSSVVVQDFNTKDYDTHNAVSGSGTGWVFTAPRTGYYSVSSQIALDATTSTYNEFRVDININGTLKRLAKVLKESTNSTVTTADVKDTFYLEEGDTFSIAASQNSGASIARSTGAWANHVTIIEEPDFKTFGAYKVDEYIELLASTDPTVSGQFANAGSKLVPQGTWLVSGAIRARSTTTASNDVGFAISEYSGNTLTDHVGSKNDLAESIKSTTQDITMTMPSYELILTSDTTMYMKTKFSTIDGGISILSGFMSFRRIK